MAVNAVKILLRGLPVRILFFAVILASLTLLANSVRNSSADVSQPDQFFAWLWVINILALCILSLLLVFSFVKLRREYKQKVLGSRLTLRLVVLFACLAIVPTTIVFFFSLQFMRDGINRWFDANVEQQLESALALSRAAIDMQIRAYKNRTETLVRNLHQPNEVSAVMFEEYRDRIGATELTLFSGSGAIPLFSSDDPGAIVPQPLSQAAVAAVRQGQPYVLLDPSSQQNLTVIVVLPVFVFGSTRQHYLQALFPVSDRLNALAESVQSAYQEYRRRSYLNEPLTLTYTISLAVILLVTLMGAIWLAFYAAKRFVQPIRELAAGTRAVAQGDYDKQLNIASRDEFGILVASFNAMTRRIAQARNEVTHSQRQAESQRAYLEAVLRRLSSGVLVLDDEYNLRSTNPSAEHVLDAEMHALVGECITQINEKYPYLEPFFTAVSENVTRRKNDWRVQLNVVISGQRRDLLCSGSVLPDQFGTPGGFVVVFDDITSLLQAQKDAAWGEVARRLAHEIKNPLTPIQLSAERIRHKLWADLAEPQQQVLEKATQTIINQVAQMKSMVNAFAEYAKAPALLFEMRDLNQIIDEVIELYRNDDKRVMIHVDLDADLPFVRVDEGRIRQLMHNLIKNAVEAIAAVPSPKINVRTDLFIHNDSQAVQLAIWDNGPGFPDNILGPLFEPYVSTKEKGTGLGLAIVKKIVEEHAATITASNREDGGAQFLIRFPELVVGESPRQSGDKNG